MSKFTDHLWDELAREHGPRLAHAPAPASGRHVAARPRILAGSTLALAGTGAGLLLALGGGAAASPAFAVTRTHDGAVSVHVYRPSGVAGANRRLAQMGVRERVEAGEDGQISCFAPGPAPAGQQTIILKVPADAAVPPGWSSGDQTTGSGGYTQTGSGMIYSPPASGFAMHETSCSIPTGNTGNTGSGS